MPTMSNQEDESNDYNYHPIPSRIPQQPTDDFFVFRITGEDVLEKIEHQLRGERIITKNGERVWAKKFDSWLSEQGIEDVLYVIHTCGINKNTFLGNLTREEINYKCLHLKKKLAKLFYQNGKVYDIDKTKRSLLISTIINPIHSALSRSEDGWEAEQLSVASQRHEIHTKTEQNKERQGIVGGLAGFLRRKTV